MRTIFFLTLILNYAIIQNGNSQSMIEYKGIRIYDFKYGALYKDSLVAKEEWCTQLNGKTLKDLIAKELDEIVRKAKKYKCTLVFMSLQLEREIINGKPGYVYILGFQRKK